MDEIQRSGDTEAQHELAPAEVESEESPSNRQRILFGLGAAAIVVALALVVGSFLAGKPWVAGHDWPKEKAALAKAWQGAKAKEARGVDFQLSVAQKATTLDFTHGGKVVAKDSCFQAESDYMVLQNGSIAIKGLTEPKLIQSAPSRCGEPGAIYSAATLSYSGGLWIAKDPSGAELLAGLKEVPAATESPAPKPSS